MAECQALIDERKKKKRAEKRQQQVNAYRLAEMESPPFDGADEFPPHMPTDQPHHQNMADLRADPQMFGIGSSEDGNEVDENMGEPHYPTPSEGEPQSTDDPTPMELEARGLALIARMDWEKQMRFKAYMELKKSQEAQIARIADLRQQVAATRASTELKRAEVVRLAMEREQDDIALEKCKERIWKKERELEEVIAQKERDQAMAAEMIAKFEKMRDEQKAKQKKHQEWLNEQPWKQRHDQKVAEAAALRKQYDDLRRKNEEKRNQIEMYKAMAHRDITMPEFIIEMARLAVKNRDDHREVLKDKLLVKTAKMSIARSKKEARGQKLDVLKESQGRKLDAKAMSFANETAAQLGVPMDVSVRMPIPPPVQPSLNRAAVVPRHTSMAPPSGFPHQPILTGPRAPQLHGVPPQKIRPGPQQHQPMATRPPQVVQKIRAEPPPATVQSVVAPLQSGRKNHPEAQQHPNREIPAPPHQPSPQVSRAEPPTTQRGPPRQPSLERRQPIDPRQESPAKKPRVEQVTNQNAAAIRNLIRPAQPHPNPMALAPQQNVMAAMASRSAQKQMGPAPSQPQKMVVGHRPIASSTQKPPGPPPQQSSSAVHPQVTSLARKVEKRPPPGIPFQQIQQRHVSPNRSIAGSVSSFTDRSIEPFSQQMDVGISYKSSTRGQQGSSGMKRSVGAPGPSQKAPKQKVPEAAEQMKAKNPVAPPTRSMPLTLETFQSQPNSEVDGSENQMDFMADFQMDVEEGEGDDVPSGSGGLFGSPDGLGVAGTQDSEGFGLDFSYHSYGDSPDGAADDDEPFF